MSQENVEVVERAMAAYSNSEPLEDLFDPEIEIWESPELPGEFVGTGYANLARGRRTLRGLFEEWSIETEKFFDLGERVLVLIIFRAKGKGSGVPVEGPLAYLVTLRDGRIIEWCLFGDRSKALEAAGLSE
jgi:ketosteroid isomerase-like protein